MLAGRCEHGLFCPDTAFTANPEALVRTLADRFVASGGEIIHADALQMRMSHGQPVGIATTDGLHSVDRVVIAAGAWSRPLAAQLGLNVPLDTARGYIAVLPHAEPLPRIPFMAVDRHIAVTPMETGLRIAGTVEFAGLSAAPNLKRADALLEGVAPLLGKSSARTPLHGCHSDLPCQIRYP